MTCQKTCRLLALALAYAVWSSEPLAAEEANTHLERVYQFLTTHIIGKTFETKSKMAFGPRQDSDFFRRRMFINPERTESGLKFVEMVVIRQNVFETDERGQRLDKAPQVKDRILVLEASLGIVQSTGELLGLEPVVAATNYDPTGRGYAIRAQLDGQKLTFIQSHAQYADLFNPDGKSSPGAMTLTNEFSVADGKLSSQIREEAFDINPKTLERTPRVAAKVYRENVVPHDEVPLLKEIVVGVRRSLDQNFDFLSEQQQLQITSSLRYSLDLFLSRSRTRPDSASSVYDEVLAWKGAVTARQVRDRTRLLEPSLRAEFGEFQRLNLDFSRHALQVPLRPAADEESPELKAWREEHRTWHERYVELVQKRDLMEADLRAKSAKLPAIQPVQKASLRDLQQWLPERTVLIDLLEYNDQSSHSALSTPPDDVSTKRQLAAYVVRKDRELVRVELGPTSRIADAVTSWQSRGMRSPFQTDSATQLRRLLLEPLFPHLDDIDTILISPDGIVAQIPWGALPGRDASKFLLEEYSGGVAVIPIPQLLGEWPKDSTARPSAAPSLLLVGDIDFGESREASPRVSMELATRASMLEELSGQRGGWVPLANAFAELSTIEARFRQSIDGGSITLLTGNQATETAFREAARKRRWIHIITHGFFANESFKRAAHISKTETWLTFGRDLLKDATGSDQTHVGVGLVLEQNRGKTIVASIVPNSPASRGGQIQPGDVLIAVAQDGAPFVDIANQRLEAVKHLLRGPLGSNVRLKLAKSTSQEAVVLELPRAKFSLPAEHRPKLETPKFAELLPGFHPGLLSGLVFSGANIVVKVGEDDGILTAVEVGSLDLSGTELVVLSACETGLGATAGGEGPLGLQRAFQVSGSAACIASLWAVPDRETSLLMQRFYENSWKKKMTKLAALRDAQLWLLNEGDRRGLTRVEQSERDDNSQRRTPPFFWAAFVLSGDWR